MVNKVKKIAGSTQEIATKPSEYTDPGKLRVLLAAIAGIWHEACVASDEQAGYIRIDSEWISGECPLCRQPAISHGWLFRDPPPRAPHRDRRTAVGAVFMHANSTDCIVYETQGWRNGNSVMHLSGAVTP
jgi:hypothetical protein